MNSERKHLVLKDYFLASWRPYIWLFLVGFLLYMQVLTFTEYTHHDDHFLIVDNFSYIDDLSDIGRAFLQDVGHQAQGGNLYRPLLTVSLILSAQISGTGLFGYHLVDILLHCINCCLLFIVLLKFDFKRPVAFIGSLIFCVHPALTQAVAWMPGRNDSLLAVFILACFIMYMKYLSTSLLKWYLLHLLFFTLALFTKETTILFPILALLYFFIFNRGKKDLLTLILLVAGWGVILANWQIMRTIAQIAPVGDKLQATATVSNHLWIIFYFIGNVFWPFNLPFAPVLSDIHITAGIISVGLIFFAIFLSDRRDWKAVFFGISWFAIFLVPTFYYHIDALYPPKFYEHRIYVPCIGIFFMLLSLSFSKRLQILKRAVPLLILLVFCFFSWLSYSHTLDYKDSLSLYEYEAKTSPNDPCLYRPITKMAVPQEINRIISAIQGSTQLSDSQLSAISKEELWRIIDYLRRELDLNKIDPDLHHALAVACYARGFYLTSEENFHTAIQAQPKNAVLPYNLGILYYAASMKKKAEKAWLDALQLEPAMGNAYLNLSYLYYEFGEYELAWLQCQKAIKYGTQVYPDLIKEIRSKIPHQHLQ